jgi:hypothetical protein
MSTTYGSISLGTVARAYVKTFSFDGRQYIVLHDDGDYHVAVYLPAYDAPAAAYARTLARSLVIAADTITLALAMAQQQVTPAEAAIVATLIGKSSSPETPSS